MYFRTIGQRDWSPYLVHVMTAAMSLDPIPKVTRLENGWTTESREVAGFCQILKVAPICIESRWVWVSGLRL